MSPVPAMASRGMAAGVGGRGRSVGGGQRLDDGEGRRAATGGLKYFRGTSFIYIMGIILVAKSKWKEGECEDPPSIPTHHPPTISITIITIITKPSQE